MANPKHLQMLKQGVGKWNQWREDHQWYQGSEDHEAVLCHDLSETDLEKANLRGINLSGANLSGSNLRGADAMGARLGLRQVACNGDYALFSNLSRADFTGARLSEVDLRMADLRSAKLCAADLSGADITGANLTGADLSGAYLAGAYLTGARLTDANLAGAKLCKEYVGPQYGGLYVNDYVRETYGRLQRGVDLSGADLSGANLSGADLSGADLSRSNLVGADLSGARASSTRFIAIDLSTAKALETIEHQGPSTIGIDTIYKSRGKIPEAFLRGCGLSDWEIEAARFYDPTLSTSDVANITQRLADILNNRPLRYYSCFISYSTKDEAFADRLYADLQAKGVRCWFAPHDIMGGRKLHEQIDEAIRVHDKLLLILSEHSMASDWVGTEISKARKREAEENKTLLFPITISRIAEIQKWELFDADRGKDSAREIREYYIPDFSGWESDHTAYQREFDRLVGALKAGRLSGPGS